MLSEIARDYLEAYITELNQAATERDVYGRLSDWHFNSVGSIGRVTGELNRHLALSGPFALQPHIATSAAGRLDGDIVILSANPGYSSKPLNRAPQGRNALEHAFRTADSTQNQLFCQQFFDKYPKVCLGYAPYWTKALALLELIDAEAPHQNTTTERLWSGANKRRTIGGIDLLPFHSTKDGVTGVLHGKRADPLLQRVALATLDMAIRLRPKMLLVTSPAGQTLVADLLERFNRPGMRIQEQDVSSTLPGHPYTRLRTWQVTQAGKATTRIVAFPYQVFSGSFRRSAPSYTYEPAVFAKVLGTLADGG